MTTANIEWAPYLGTCTGLAAMRSPATPPPTTRPSGPAKETLIPPDLLLVPPASLGMNEPDKDSISKRPCHQEKMPKHCRGSLLLHRNTWGITITIDLDSRVETIVFFLVLWNGESFTFSSLFNNRNHENWGVNVWDRNASPHMLMYPQKNQPVEVWH